MPRNFVTAATTSLLVGMVVASSTSVAQASPEVRVRIAKTTRYVKAFGTVEPADRGGAVSVRLFRYDDEQWVRIARRRVEVTQGEDVDGDGIVESAYKARFDRPETGACRVVAVHRTTRARDEQEFPCEIPNFPSGTATISGLADEVQIRLLIAETNAHRQYGLMYRPRLPSDLGMAFLFETDTNGGFWMKNTLIPLSIAFFDANGVIVRIMDMEPCLEDPCQTYNPGMSYRGALEVNQGAFDDWGVAEGDRIEITRDG